MCMAQCHSERIQLMVNLIMHMCMQIVSLHLTCNLAGLYMQNVTVGLDQDCLQSYDCADEWRCAFAPVNQKLTRL